MRCGFFFSLKWDVDFFMILVQSWGTHTIKTRPVRINWLEGWVRGKERECQRKASCIIYVLSFIFREWDVSFTKNKSSCVCVCVCVWVCVHAQLCPILCDSMDCSPLGSSVHGMFQARILEWVAICYSRGSSPSRDRTCIWFSCISYIWQAVSLPLYHLGNPLNKLVKRS